MKQKVAIFSGILILLGVIIFLVIGNVKKDKLAWVNLNKVHGDFIFKKELENKLIKTEEARKKIIDSLEFELQVLARQIKSENGKDKNKLAIYETKRQKYFDKKNEFEEDNSVLQQQYNEQILTQINQYMKDFGKQNGYTFIFGADGTGGLMYADEARDVTEAAIVFINEKYKGKSE